jgi:pimeloyl-ACP methyl ester carboxylesterase
MRLLGAMLGFLLFTATSAPPDGLAPGPILAAAPSQYVTLDGARVHYKVVGRGKATIVFLHGLGGNLNVWREQVAAMHSRARLILIDLPGHGGSGAPASYSMHGFARAVNAVLKATRDEHAILVGHSLGALVAREVDRYYPAHCRAIVSVEGLLRNPLPDAADAKKTLDSFRGDEGDARVAQFYDAMLMAAPPATRDEIRAVAVATPRNAFIATLEAALAPEAWVDDKVSVPLYAIIARDNPHNDEAYQQYVRSLGKDVTVDVIDGTDHFLMLDEKAGLNARLEKWLILHKWLR